jgi:hypothetical protein
LEIPFVGGKLPDSCKNPLIKVQRRRERGSPQDEYEPGNMDCRQRDRHFVTNRIDITDSLVSAPSFGGERPFTKAGSIQVIPL